MGTSVMDQRDSTNYVGEYRLGSEIGRGSFAYVYKGIHRSSNRPVAIKSVLKAKLNKKLLENLESEISILKTMKHPHVVSLLDCHQTSQYFHLVMEYCSLGDLSFFIRKREDLAASMPLVRSLFQRFPNPPSGHGLNEALVVHFLKQLSSALEFLRSKNLVHRDIKPQNLLLCPPARSEEEFVQMEYVGSWELPVLKLADFGFARFLPNSSMAETLCGSPLYMAPEILRFEKYNAKADLWSVGAVLYEMSVGKPPFRASNHVELLKKIEKADSKVHFPESCVTSEPLRDLIRSLLKRHPTERIGFMEFFANPIIVRSTRSKASTPLDCSQLNERMFISEYISGPAGVRSQSPGAESDSVLAEENPESSEGTSLASRTENESKSTGLAALETADREREGNERHSPDTSVSPGPSLIIPDHTSVKELIRTPRNVLVSHKQQDLALERDYVVVEKTAVEVNALADELSTQSDVNRAISGDSHQSQQSIPQSRRGSASSSSSMRRLSVSLSPTNALSKALNMASIKLFGTRIDSSGTTMSVSPPSFAQQTSYSPRSHSSIHALNSPVPSNILDETALIAYMESLAAKANAIFLFAEVKFTQLVPTPPSRSNGSEAPSALCNSDDWLVAQQAVALYLKTLSLLSKCMTVAGEWWRNNSSRGATVQLSEIVQWVRDKFNEALEKAEYAKQKAYGGLESDEMRKREIVVAERLIFDRALEMSRAAAVNELMNEDLNGCELAYGTALWMLEALLENDGAEPLDKEDQSTVEKFIEGIAKRLSILRKKMDSLQ